MNLSIENLENLELNAYDLLQFKELQSMISSDVEELPERMKEIYRMSRIEYLKTHEIAARLCISEQTVKNTLTITQKYLAGFFTGGRLQCLVQ